MVIYGDQSDFRTLHRSIYYLWLIRVVKDFKLGGTVNFYMTDLTLQLPANSKYSWNAVLISGLRKLDRIIT